MGTEGLIAILRGLRPDEAAEIGEAVLAGGITTLEVPLNSPSPLASIAILREQLGDRATVGAGMEVTGRAGDAGASRRPESRSGGLARARCRSHRRWPVTCHSPCTGGRLRTRGRGHGAWVTPKRAPACR